VKREEGGPYQPLQPIHLLHATNHYSTWRLDHPPLATRHPLLPDMQIKVPSDPLSSLSSALPNALPPSSCCCFYSCSVASMLAFSNLSKTPFIDSSCIINVVNDHSTSVAKKKKNQKAKRCKRPLEPFEFQVSSKSKTCLSMMTN
jgi:hypothetical protein